MISFRNFIVFLMFSVFFVGCQTPFIDIDVKHSSGGGQASGGGTCPDWAIPLGCIDGRGASIPLFGKVTKIETFTNTTDATDTIHVYTIDPTDGSLDRKLRVPPWVVSGSPALNDDVKVTYINAQIEKVGP